nr:kelch protein 18 [Hymenolepis microstoma]
MESGAIEESGRVNSRFSRKGSYKIWQHPTTNAVLKMRLLQKPPNKLLSTLAWVEDRSPRKNSVIHLLSPPNMHHLQSHLGNRCNFGHPLAALTAYSKPPITLSCSSCGSVGTAVLDTIPNHTRLYESHHVTCEAAIKPTMVSKRLTASIQPLRIDVSWQVRTYKVEYSMDAKLSRNQLSQLTAHDMTSELMNTPNLLRRMPSKKRTHSRESHRRSRTSNICSSCRSRVMITDISTADPDDANSYTKGGTTISAHKLVLCARFPGIKKSILNGGHSKLSNWSRFPHRLDRLNLMEVWLAGNVTSNNDLIGACIPRIACSVYTLGGRSDSDKSTSIVERINPLNGEVTELKPMIGERNYHSAVARDHAILVFGGYNQQSHTFLDSCEEFTPATNTWRQLPKMPTPRSSTGAAHIPGVGEIVVGGCKKFEDGRYFVVDSAEIYLTNSSSLEYAGSWCQIAPMLNKRSIPSTEFFNGKVYVAGYSDSVEMLSIFTEGPPQWTELTTAPLRPHSMISFEGSLLFGTAEGEIYELLFIQDDENSSKQKNTWKLLSELDHKGPLRLLKVNDLH